MVLENAVYKFWVKPSRTRYIQFEVSTGVCLIQYWFVGVAFLSYICFWVTGVEKNAFKLKPCWFGNLVFRCISKPSSASPGVPVVDGIALPIRSRTSRKDIRGKMWFWKTLGNCVFSKSPNLQSGLGFGETTSQIFKYVVPWTTSCVTKNVPRNLRLSFVSSSASWLCNPFFGIAWFYVKKNKSLDTISPYSKKIWWCLVPATTFTSLITDKGLYKDTLEVAFQRIIFTRYDQASRWYHFCIYFQFDAYRIGVTMSISGSKEAIIYHIIHSSDCTSWFSREQASDFFSVTYPVTSENCHSAIFQRKI